MAGGIVVHVPFNITDARDANGIVLIAECKVVFIDPGRRNEYMNVNLKLIESIGKGSNRLTLVFLRKCEHVTSYDDLPEILQLNAAEVEFPSLYPEDEIVFFTTSGSTGKPKMIPKTHFLAINCRITFPGKTYNDRPFAWSGGSPIFTVYQGEPRVFYDSSVAIKGRNTMEIWEIIKEEQCSSAKLLPYFLSDLVDHEKNYKDSFKLDVVITTGQLVENRHTKIVGVFTKNITVGYGLTEILWVSTLPPITTAGEMKTGDIGKPMQDIEVKITDEEGKVLRKGENGELCIRSICGFEKYYKNPDSTDEVLLPGGWFCSGDIAQVSEQNNIMIKGRIKDCISRGTRKIIPSSIEEIIIRMIGIKDVIVVDVPDERLYEEICVCYVMDPWIVNSPSDVKQFCMENFNKQDNIDGLGEMPKYFLRFHSMPMLDNGKINKRQLRINAIEQLELVDQM